MTGAYGSMAAVYDEWMRHLDYSAWWHYLRTTFAIGDSQSILELGCGTGNLTKEIAKDGHALLASDLSGAMLTQAEAKLRDRKNVSFMLLDMRSLPKALGSYDLIVAACDAVNYLRSYDELEQFLHGARALLKPHGLLLFDVHGPGRMAEFSERPERNRVGVKSCYLWSVALHDTLITHRLTGFLRDNENSWSRFDEVHLQRYFTPTDIAKAATSAGFTRVQGFDFLSASQPHDKSKRLQFSCSAD